MQVLIVDDDFEVRDLLVHALERDGHGVAAVATAAAARSLLHAGAIDLVVLDLALPDGSGLDLCVELRAALDAVPVLMLTAHSDVPERVRALDAGADDFLAKPFAVAELRARVRALGRRRDKRLATSKVIVHDVTLDFTARRALRQGKAIMLTPREWLILESLVSESGGVVSRASLLKDAWGEISEANAASLEVLVGRIRRKLGEEIVRTVRGVGYSLGSA